MLFICSLRLHRLRNYLGKCSEGIEWEVRAQWPSHIMLLWTGVPLHVCLPPSCTAGPILSTVDAAVLGSGLINDHSPDGCSEYAGAAERELNAAADTNKGIEMLHSHSSHLTAVTSCIPQTLPSLSEQAPSLPSPHSQRGSYPSTSLWEQQHWV